MAKHLELMSGTYETLKHTVASAAKVAGDDITLNQAFGFFLVDGAVGDEVAIVVKADTVKAAKQAALAINEGDAVYFDTVANEVDKTNTNTLCGYCVKPALAADTHVYIAFDGFASFLKA